MPAVGFFSQHSVLLSALISGGDSLGAVIREALQAQQTESLGSIPCARKFTESTESLFFSRAAWYWLGVMPGCSKALPSAEGFDFAQISAAVGAVILERGGTGLVKNMSSQGTLVVTCPGKPIWIMPPHAQVHIEVLLRAGMPPIITVGEPGVQGMVTGIHGIGVSTPRAAAVAAATVGLAMDMHMPNGGMLTIGAQSTMVAAGEPAFVLLTGRTFSVEGAMPNVHIIIAPGVTS